MKLWIFALMSLYLSVGALAQLPMPISEAQVKVVQARINMEREGLEAQFASQEADCYKRFAVNDCLRDVRAAKRVSIETLRRQEIVLNDAQRKTRDMEWVKQTQEKTSSASLKQAADSREAAQIQHQERIDRTQQKKTDAAQKKMQEGPEKDQRTGVEGSAVKGVSAQAQQAFEEKQRSAQERKMQRDKSLSEKSHKPVSPLPPYP
jgi:colicin import membrane protein